MFFRTPALINCAFTDVLDAMLVGTTALALAFANLASERCPASATLAQTAAFMGVSALSCAASCQRCARLVRLVSGVAAALVAARSTARSAGKWNNIWDLRTYQTVYVASALLSVAYGGLRVTPCPDYAYLAAMQSAAILLCGVLPLFTATVE